MLSVSNMSSMPQQQFQSSASAIAFPTVYWLRGARAHYAVMSVDR